MGQLEHKGEYPLNWPEIAKLVKDDVEWVCVRCGNPHNPKAGYCMTVHHFDGDKCNCARWNLMPLCQRCHLSVQARVNPQVGLLILPSVWAMPYIAGFYEAGRGVAGPLYDLSKWIEMYEAAGKRWPKWAVLPKASVANA